MKTGLNSQEQNKFKRDVKAGVKLSDLTKIYNLTPAVAKSWFKTAGGELKTKAPSLKSKNITPKE